MKRTICYAPANIDACAMWRMFFPHLHLPGSRFMFTGGMPPVDEMLESDIVCCQRMMTQQNITFLKQMRAYGMRVIYDLDDNVWNLPKTNPAYHIFSRPDVLEGMQNCAEWADVITVSTKPLQKMVTKHWGHLRNAASKKEIPVMLCENRIDPMFYHPNSIENEQVVIGWAGSNTHAGDLAEIWPALQSILNDYPNVMLHLVGHSAPFLHPNIRQGQWVHISEFSFRLRQWNWDIFLAPLEEHKFNLSKSNIKMQEAGALKRPCLASWIKPYTDFVGDNVNLRWLLCTGTSMWENRLRKLIEDAQYRKSLGNAMYKHTLDNFHVEQTTAEWEAAAQACF